MNVKLRNGIRIVRRRLYHIKERIMEYISYPVCVCAVRVNKYLSMCKENIHVAMYIFAGASFLF